MRNKVLKTLGHVRNFTYLGAKKLSFRADCGSFSKEIVRIVERNVAIRSISVQVTAPAATRSFAVMKDGKTVEIGYEKCEVTSLDMDDFVEGKSYRLVVQRSPLKDKDGNVQSDHSIY